MANLVNSANVWHTCLRILDARGYALAIDLGPYEEEEAGHAYTAERDGYRFVADDPISLLGLTAVYDHVQPTSSAPYWWQVEGRDIRGEIMGVALEEAFFDLRERNVSVWQACIRRAQRDCEANPALSMTEALGISASGVTRARADDMWPEP